MLRYDAISLQARLRPATVALHDLTTDRRWTYAEADLAVSSAVAALARLGVGAGDRVALYAKNCADTVLLHFACARRGAMLVPYNWRLAAEEIAALNADAEPRLVLVDEGLPDPGLDAISMEAWRDEVETADVPADSVFDHDRASLILYTSGTTGRPKGAVLTEGNLAATAHNFAILGAVGAGSVFLCDAPMFHVIGLVANVRPVLLCGGTLLVSDGFDPERALRRLMDEDLGVTHYFCVPQMAHALRAQKSYDPDRLRRLAGLFTGGAPHAAAQIEAWLDDGIAAVDGYGMSEVGTLCSMPLDLGLIRRHAGAVGVAPPGVALRIGDGEGRAAPEGEPGEVFVQGPNVFTGYWRDDTATKDAFTEDGWFRTGDVGRIDAEGYVWLVGRRKDMYISGGENVYPAEIESTLARHPMVADCAVVQRADAQWGEVGHLFVVPGAGATPDADALLHDLQGRLARYKIPKFVSFIDRLPRNAAGKTNKAALQKLIEEGCDVAS